MKFSQDKYKFFTTANKVIAVSTYAGRSVRGTAKCDPRDSFDLEKGKKLAAARCNEKVAQKRLQRAVQKQEEAVKEYNRVSERLDKMADYVYDSQIEAVRAEDAVKNLLTEM
jgi:hypothetical protein